MKPTAAPIFWKVCLLFALPCVGASGAGEEALRWNPEIVQTVKKMPLEELFANYKGFEFRSRTDGTYLREIQERPEAVEFLSAKLKKDRAKPDTKERIEARGKAAHILGKMGERAKPAVPLLIAALEDENDVRVRVTQAFFDLGPVAIEAEPALLEELHFQNPQAARALFRIDPTSEEVLKAVIERVLDPSMEQGFRWQTMDAFYECKVKSDRKKKFLEEVANGPTGLADSAKRQLQMTSWQTQRYLPPQPPGGPETNASVLLDKLKSNPDDWPTAQALGKSSAEARHDAALILIHALKGKRARFPQNIVSMLGLFGKEAKPAIPLLIVYAEGDESGLANNALAALGEIGPDAIDAKTAAEQALSDGSSLLRWRAANTLCLIDPENFESHFDRLLAELKEDNGEYGEYGIRFLGKFGSRAKKAVPLLLGLLQNDSLRLSAAEALVKIEAGDAVVLPHHDLLPVGLNAGDASGAVTPDATVKTQVARAISKDLKNDNIYWRDNSARLLGEIGPDAREALPELRVAARSDDLEFAKIAKEAIQKIEGDTKEGK